MPRHQPHTQHLLQVNRSLVAVDHGLAFGLQLFAQHALVIRRLDRKLEGQRHDRSGSKGAAIVAP